MRMISYNVRYFGHATRGLASTRNAVKRIAHALASLDPLPGLMCLQEVETSSFRSTVADPSTRPNETQLERLMEALDAALAARGVEDRYVAYYFPAHSYRVAQATPFYTTGLAILAHRDFVVIDHHNAKDPIDITHRNLHPIRGLKQTRICAHVRFRYRGAHTLDVFNTHLSLPSTLSREFWTSPARLGYGRNQLAEAKNVASFVTKEAKNDRFILVGDFNALPGSPVYRYLVGEAGFRDAFAEVERMDERALRDWPTAGFLAMRMHLDHVFTGRALNWLDFQGSRPFGDRESAFHGLSDHVPLIGHCHVV